MKRKRNLLAMIVILVMIQAAWLIWLIARVASGAGPFRVSDGFSIVEQIFLDIFVFYILHKYWNSQKDSK